MSGLLSSIGSAAKSGIATAAGNSVGALGQFGLGELSAHLALNRSKKLYDYQTDYKKLMDKMLEAGITPSAAAQGLSGATPSMQSVSAQAPPKLDNLGTAASEASAVPSQIQSNVAIADYNKSLRDKTLQEIEWRPRIWRADIRKSFSEFMSNVAQSKYFNSLRGYYDEMKETVVQRRPWEIKGLKRGLVLANAQIDELRSRKRLNDSQTEYNYTNAFNQGQQGFEMMWRNNLLAHGWNPNGAPWQNLTRVAFTNPKMAQEFLANGIQFLDILDNKAKEGLGEHYKRNIMLGIGAYKGLKSLDRKSEIMLRMMPMLMSGVGGAPVGAAMTMPFMGSPYYSTYSF